MSASFSVGSRAILPFAVTDQAFERTTNTVFNPTAGGALVANAIKASPRTGSMTAVFTDFAAALDFDNMLAGVAPITWSDTATSLTIRFLPDQTISLTQSDEQITLADGTDTYLWGVTFSFWEV